ncbi:TFIIB-type zinc ribbon-containing protein [Nocardioides daeguensis]|uniref:Zf-TFIIB domain-containing protein n=1 Tax=Nocardioides daeguensis TaxID=908359 RepID=A0ABP6VDZ2_9ACTN|nr:zf-TFIIB domain-containing protein [Nocardioides daeguensis]MBV6727299.1 zf-TFIIB domain-containing protein [Nocardioides daeguensis]MCR1771313.1 zf-TFIIB domain-containing protein [Nocardioides daeguensis]
MRCPIDETTLVMSERNGIEIDYCPQCRGVWLDRGELDKIIDRSVGMPQPAAQQPTAPQPTAPYDAYRAPHQQYPPQQGHYKKRKRESWLSELFD